MKKFKISLLIILAMFMFLPLSSVKAETETYYPVGINDYVDLNNVKQFAVSGQKVFYVKADNKVICYDKSTKVPTILTESQYLIKHISIENNLLFVFSNTGVSAYNVDSLASVHTAYLPSNYSAIVVDYLNDNYVFAYTLSTFSSMTLHVDIYDDLESIATDKFQYSLNMSSDYSIAMSDKLIVVQERGKDNIILFNHPTTSLTPIKDSIDNDYHVVTGLNTGDNILDMVAVDSGDDTCIVLALAEHTLIGQFNGSALKSFKSNLVCNKFAINGNNLYVYNSENANINLFEIQANNNVFKATELVLAGKGNEIGRFDNVTDLNYHGGVIYVTDSGNNRVQVLADEIITSTTDGEITEVVADSYNNYYYAVYKGTDTKLYKNKELVKTYSNTRVVSIDINLDDSLVLLTTNSKIMFFGKTQEDIDITNVNITDNSKIRLNTDLNASNNTLEWISLNAYMTVSSGNNIYMIDGTGAVVKTRTYSANVLDYKFNYHNKMYVLLANGDMVAGKLTENMDTYTTKNGFSDYSALSIDIASGEMYLFNTKSSSIEKYTDPEFSPEGGFSHPTSTYSHIWDYASVKANALVYEYYYFKGNNMKLSADTNVFVMASRAQFVYVGFVKDGELYTGYVRRSDLASEIKAVAESEGAKISTTNKNVSAYIYPTIYSKTLYSFPQGTVVTSCGKYLTSVDGDEYYIVKIGNQYGYVCATDVVPNKNIAKRIKTNASIRIFDQSDRIDVYLTGEDGASVLYRLTDGHKINVVDYDKNSKYTQITFIDEDQQEREGYVLTSYVKMNGISPTVLTAIILLVLDVIITVIVIVFFCHYRKKQREKVDMEILDDNKKDNQ